MGDYEAARRLAVVTGAGSGIGQACAHQLADDGFAIGVIDVDAQAAQRTAATLTSHI